MVDVTLSRDGTSVDIPVLDSSAGTPLISKDLGDPELQIQPTGTLDPRHQDQWSGNEQYTILGRFKGSNAHSDAIKLADLIKSNSNGNDLILSIPLNDFDDNIIVAPAAGQEESISISYPPGRKNWVEIDLALTRVSETNGGADQPASTPTASGSGPIQLSYRSTTVDLVEDISISRGVGRPNSVVKRAPDRMFPRYYDKHKTAFDGFELSFRFTDNTVSTMNDLVDMFNTKLGRTSFTLDFNGTFGMGAFNVVPSGSQSLRQTRPSGHKDTILVPTVNLRRVL